MKTDQDEDEQKGGGRKRKWRRGGVTDRGRQERRNQAVSGAYETPLSPDLGRCQSVPVPCPSQPCHGHTGNTMLLTGSHTAHTILTPTV